MAAIWASVRDALKILAPMGLDAGVVRLYIYRSRCAGVPATIRPPGLRLTHPHPRIGLAAVQPGSEGGRRGCTPPLGAAASPAGRGGPPHFSLLCVVFSSLLALLKMVESYLAITTKPCGK